MAEISKTHFRKKARPLMLASALGLILVSFQNCAPQASQCGSGSSSSSGTSSECSTSSASTAGASSSKTPSQNNSNLVIGGSVSSGSSVTANNGAITVGGGSGSTGNGGGAGAAGNASAMGGSTGTGSFGSGGFFGGSSSGTSGGAFRLLSQPAGVTVSEKQDFTLSVAAAGGQTPYTFQWYKDGAPLNLGSYSFYTDVADTWRKEGLYYVVVKDASGASLNSQSVRVGITEPTTGCNAGNYFTYTNATYDQAYQYFSLYFDGPRGKYLIHQSYDFGNIIFANSRYTGMSYWTFPKLNHLQNVNIACTQNVPRIHSAEGNPGGYYNDCWQYQGSVNFECHNNKIKFISDTCKWVEVPNCSGNY